METPLLKINAEAAAAADYAPVRTFGEAMEVSRMIKLVMLWSAAKEEWTGFLLLAFREIWDFAKLSLATCMMVCQRLWYSMSISLLAGLLPNAVFDVGSLSICMNFWNWEIMLLLGINAAISTRVSNELGMGRLRAAKYSVCVAVLQAPIVEVLAMVAIFISRDYSAMIFTSSGEMQLAVARLAYLLGVTMLLTSATQVLTGVAIGGGWQVMVAYINFGSYYLVGLPLAIFLGFKANLGAVGLWGGIMNGNAFQIFFLLILICRINWDSSVYSDILSYSDTNSDGMRLTHYPNRLNYFKFVTEFRIYNAGGANNKAHKEVGKPRNKN